MEELMIHWTKATSVAVLLVGFFMAVFLVSGSPLSGATPQGSAQDVYLDKCSVCHGKDGSGNTAKGRKLKVKDVKSPEVQKMTDAQLIEIVSKGKGTDMDGFEKDLGKDMVKNIVTYYRSLAK
jgi:mono/diheme cytochrome c family protein